MSENSQPLANTKIVNTKFIDDSLTQTISDYSFDIYQSLSKKIIIIYQTTNYTLKCLDYVDLKCLIEIKFGCRYYLISHIHHYIDENAKIEIVLLAFRDFNTIQVWDCCVWECVLILEPINKFGSLGPSRFLNYNNSISIITSNRDGFELTCLQAFNLYGKRIKTINNSDKRTYSMAIYTNNQNENKKCFIIVGYDHFIISYDYNKNQVYKCIMI